MQCINGHENPESARFCGLCGQEIVSSFQTGNPNGAGGTASFQSFQVQGPSLQSLRASLLGDLQTHRHTGYPVNFQSILAMVSGALFAIAFALIALTAVADSDSDSPYAAGFFWATLGCVAVYLFTRFVSSGLLAGATTAFVSLSALSLLLLFGSSVEDGNIGGALILLGVVYALAWAMPILRGRPALLAASLVTFFSGLVVLVLQSAIADAARCGTSEYTDCLDDPTEFLTSIAQKSSTLFLVVGIILLAIAWTLDRKDWPEIARVFVGVGIFFEINGAFGVWQSSGDRTAASILLTLAGALLVLVAVQRSRKTSLILGALGALIGIVAFISAITDSNDSATGFIFLTLLASVGVGFLCVRQSSKIQALLQSVGNP